MKKTVSMAITMLLVLTSIFAMSGCWNQGISQEDFMLEIDKVVVDGNKVKVETSFHNSSFKFVKVISRGSEEDVYLYNSKTKTVNPNTIIPTWR